MINTIKNDVEEIQEWVSALSLPRLSNYRSFFNAANSAEALGLYHWNEDLSALFFRLVCLIEIILRNRVHRVMSMRHGTVGTRESRDWYMHVALNPRSKAKIAEITHFRRGKQLLLRVPAKSPDDVISQLSFGFWPHLLHLREDITGQQLDWGQILIEIFPGHRQRHPTYWEKVKHRDVLFARLDLCNDIRNRVAHHEPIWKLGPLIEESCRRAGRQPTLLAKAPSTPNESLARLQLLYERLVELLVWLNPRIAAQHQRGEAHARCCSMFKPQSLLAYRQSRLQINIDLAHIKSLKHLRKALRYAKRRQQTILLNDGHRKFGAVN